MSDSGIIFVGLGNPGSLYERTRHNVGFFIVDYFAGKHSLTISKKGFDGFYVKGSIAGKNVFLLKPQTYMNLSGRSIRALAAFFKISADKIVVICDDFALPIGTLRMRAGGSDGGHNGLGSAISELSNRDFIRLRVGVGPLPQGRSSADFVLSNFSRDEMSLLEKTVIPKSAEAMDFFLENGLERTMNFYNAFYGEKV